MKHVSEVLPAIIESKGIRKSELKLIEAAAVIREEPACDLAYMASELVQCTLPHSDPGDVARWSRVNGNLTLTLVSAVGYPYGSIPRLLLHWITAEAVRLQSPKIQFADSLSDFLRDVGFNPRTGSGPRSDYQRVQKQVRRLFASMISFSRGNGSMESRLNMLVADGSELWWSPRNPDQPALFGSWVRLGENFFRAIIADPVPLDTRALKALRRSPLALDLYSWVTHKVYSVKRQGKPSQFVPWKGLHDQFGGDYSDMSNFRKKAKAALRKIQVVYPELKLRFVDGGLEVLSNSQLAVVDGQRRVASLSSR